MQPWLSIWGVFWTSIFISITGLAVFFDFNANDFLVAYINLPIFVALIIGWKLAKRTRMVHPSKMDFKTVSLFIAT